ncbi:MAG: putative T7SS-secreted protein, partial [Rhodococcus sp. (in: high G+C Gram-positive bacteria)]
MSFLDDLGNKVQDTLELGAEAVGHAFDAGLDAVADKARSNGLSGVGNALDSAGDIVASWTGGAVDERELGETLDPKQLIRGESGAITDAATTLTTMASGLDQTADALSSIDASSWTGDAADAFRAEYSAQPPMWRDGAEAMGSASSALEWWSHTVVAAQAQAAVAIDLWAQAEQIELTGRVAAAAGA